jgi:hypothetical protein
MRCAPVTPPEELRPSLYHLTRNPAMTIWRSGNHAPGA